MGDLLANYSLEQIIAFIVTLALAIKGCISFFDWGIDRLRKLFDKEHITEQNKKDLNNRIETDEKKIQELVNLHKKTEQNIQDLTKSVEMLIASDKDDIKSWITEQHHKFCYGKSKSIDAYSLDCIEKRYGHYKDEGGNSFVHTLMEDLRKLTVYYPGQDDDNENQDK